jgi:hypothetical protein
MAKQQTGRQRSEARRQIVISNPSVCYYCKSTGLTESDNFCPNCGFPQKGNQASMKRFIWNVNNKHTLLDKHKKAINKARNILYGLSAICLVVGILVGVLTKSNISIIITNVIASGIYLSLGLWSRKNPFPAILTGFFVYITIQVINVIYYPSTIYQGLVLKAFIIGGFVYGYKGVKDANALEKELESIKKAKDLTVPDEVSEMSN